MTYSINDTLCGFRFDRIRQAEQVHGILHEMTHPASGARLIYLQTEDRNKLFSVSFKTIPEDDTGVFHILEHSVLSGSEKYPVREPFVELLKSSMNTFLNALTFPDKTLYPVSSRNSRDFRNLMGVYLDAVFAPRAMTNPNIFYQEGWHYELTEGQDQPTYKGVVYNEMKGAESSVDTCIRNEIKRMLFGDTCYGYISGGKVDQIPSLTYQHYKDMYAKYYHPSNAIFYLEGDLNLEEALSDIAAYLERFNAMSEEEKATIFIPLVEAPAPQSRTAYYDCGQEEGGQEDRAHIAYAKFCGAYDDVRKALAVYMLSDYLTGSNEAPLTKAILSRNLAEDISIGLQDGIKQPYFQINVTNCNPKDREEIHHVIFDTVRELVAGGLSRHDMRAALNEMEFHSREEDEPKALYHNIMVLESAAFGGDPMLYLETDEYFTFLREMLDTDYYEKLVEEIFDESQMQQLLMLPSTSLGEQKRQDEEARLATICAGWTQADREEILALNENLRRWQETPDSQEALDTIPKLALSDVDPLPIPHPMTVRQHRGVNLLEHGEGTSGIAYMNVYFEVPYRRPEDLARFSLFPSMLGILSTAERGPLEFQVDCQEHLGDLSYDINTEAKAGEMESCLLNFEISIAALNHQLPQALRLVREVIQTTRFDEYDLIQQKLQQRLEKVRRSIIGSGQVYGLGFIASADVAETAVEDALHGMKYYWYLKHITEHFDEEKEDLCDFFRQVQAEIFTRDHMTISITTNEGMEQVINVDEWIDAFPAGRNSCDQAEFDPRPKDIPDRCAIVIPSGVSYATMYANMERLGSAYAPKWRILSNILRYEYLWDEIRVHGGAYGTAAAFSNLNSISFHSYRDPDPIRSLGVFSRTGEFMRRYIDGAESLDNAIISTLAAMEPMLSAADIGDHYDSLWMRESSYEKRSDFRRKVLALTPSDLKECADAFELMAGNHRECVVCHTDIAEKLEAQGYRIYQI